MRPKTRGDCIDGPRPCPWASCKFNLILDVDPRTGRITENFSDVDELPYGGCALDLADEGGAKLERVGAALNVTRERVRQIESKRLPILRRAIERADEREEEQRRIMRMRQSA